jgi:hypothetical protein
MTSRTDVLSCDAIAERPDCCLLSELLKYLDLQKWTQSAGVVDMMRSVEVMQVLSYLVRKETASFIHPWGGFSM